MQNEQPELSVERRGALGLLILNRPRVINALTHGMIRGIHAALRHWADDDTVRTVAITGAGDRGLCAGGDIVTLYRLAVAGDVESAAAFWRDEYRLNLAISRYPKPFVAIMDGVVLGGGIGISAHGSHRVVTERSKLGMPETAIGFVPDVGGTWLLSRAPGELGTWLALTSRTVGAGDGIALGLADFFVPAERIRNLLTALETVDVAAALTDVSEPAPHSPLLARQRDIDAAFSAPTVSEIVQRLGDDEAAADLGSKSPTALAVTLEALRRARELSSLEDVLVQEFRVSLRCIATPDFAEGVRAQVIDKDRSPRWSPATHAEVSADAVASFFDSLGERELDL